jgi:hypothetical protein
MNTRLVSGLAAALLALGSGALAFADGTNTVAATPAPTPPATAAPNPIPTLPGGIVNDAINALGGIVKAAYGWNDTESFGTVTYYRGYDIQLKMQLNRYRAIHLHRGTVINPRGYSIHDGDTIDVRGTPQSDGSLNADMIVVQGR